MEKETERKLNENNVVLPLEFVLRTMKVLEIAQHHMPPNTEQTELVGKYANTYYHEVKNHLSDEELEYIEDHLVLPEL